jgi:hypothetical protein
MIRCTTKAIKKESLHYMRLLIIDIYINDPTFMPCKEQGDVNLHSNFSMWFQKHHPSSVSSTLGMEHEYNIHVSIKVQTTLTYTDNQHTTN